MDRFTYQQRHLFEADPSIALSKREDQWFDRKSGRIRAIELANDLVAFANADGGTLVVGIEGGRIVGVDTVDDRVNALRQAALDFTVPPVRHTVSELPCLDDGGHPVKLLVFEIHPSDHVHRNNRGDVFLRVGDESRRLTGEAARELEYDKGSIQYDGSPVVGASIADLDLSLVSNFREAISSRVDELTTLRARSLVYDRDGHAIVTPAALLLFGREPQRFFPNASIRIVRYEGSTVETGTRSNLTLDRRIEGPLPSQLVAAQALIESQLREYTVLDEETGRFVVTPELPRFAWWEAVVNAVTHRSYSVQGDCARVRLFENRIDIESPGGLPGPVRIDNIRQTRFSRNPRIARVLADLGFVRELNEGINRIFQEMELAGLPEPALSLPGSSFRITLHSQSNQARRWRESVAQLLPADFAAVADHLSATGAITTAEARRVSATSAPTTRRYLRELERNGLLIRVGSSWSDPRSYWRVPFPVQRRLSTTDEPGERTRKDD